MFHIKAIEIIARSLRGAVDNTPEGRVHSMLQEEYRKAAIDAMEWKLINIS